MTKQFVSEPIAPVGDGFESAAMTHGEPGLPAAFRWRDETLDVRAVLKAWRSTKDDRGDTYLKRHWYEVETADGRRVTIYFDRQARRGAHRWWLYTLEPATSTPER